MTAKSIMTTTFAMLCLLASDKLYAENSHSQLLYNVNGYTLKANILSKFNAVQFNGDTIEKVFTANDELPDVNSITSINGQGKTLLPGLIDAHGHVLSYGLSLMRVDLVNTKSEQEAVERTIAYRKKYPNQTWIQGRGWNQVHWSNNAFPTAASLDKHFPDTPVFLSRVDGHAGWANSKAMELAGITKNTKAPTGGEIIKDSQGNPTGIFIDYAVDLINEKIEKLTLSEQKQVLVTAMNELAKVGLTSVHDAGVNSENLAVYQALAKENAMPIRINAMLYLPTKNWQQTIAKGKFHSADNMLAFNSVKIQADGALGSRGAALHQDYSDDAGNKGLLLHEQKALEQYIEKAMQLGFQVNTHAIGDHANSLVLDLYKKYSDKTKTSLLRHRVEHAQVLRLSDIPKFAELDVIASIQSTHATSDKNMAEDRIGSERLKGAYAWRSLLNSGAKIANGSDFPVEPTNPFYGLHAAITRQDRENHPLGGWISSEKLTPIEAFKSFTIDAAYAGHQEKLIGSIEVGKKADFILIDNDLFEQKPSTIWQNKVIATWVNGKLVYKN